MALRVRLPQTGPDYRHVAKVADAPASKAGDHWSCGFESRRADHLQARLAKLADAPGLGPDAARHCRFESDGGHHFTDSGAIGRRPRLKSDESR